MAVLAVDHSPATGRPCTFTNSPDAVAQAARAGSQVSDSERTEGPRQRVRTSIPDLHRRLAGRRNLAAFQPAQRRGLVVSAEASERVVPPPCEAATKIEDAASAAGTAAGLVTSGTLHRLGLPRLVQKIGQTIVAKAIPKIGESQTVAVAHCLRVIGVWLCVARDDPLQACPCFESVATGHTEDWIEDELTRHPTCLRATAAGVT